MRTLNLEELDGEPTPAPILATSPRPAASSPVYPSNDVLAEVDRYVVAAEATGTLPDDYDTWFTKTALPLATQGEAGREYFHRLSRLSPKYDRDVADAKFTNALKTKRGEVTIATFFWMCHEVGIRPERLKATKKGRIDDFKALQKNLAAKGYDLPPQVLAEAVATAGHAKKDGRKSMGVNVMTQVLNVPEEAAHMIAGAVNAKPSLAIQNEQRTATQDDIRDALSMEWDFYYDPGKRTYYYRKAGSDDPKDLREFDDRSTFLHRLLSDLERNGTKTDKRKLEQAVFNPYCYTEINYLTTHLDYLASQYDGEDHVAALLKCLKTDNDELFARIFKKWLLNTVAQAYCGSSTCRNENALILVSPQQGVGKTTFFQNLLWDDQFFALSVHFDFNNKEDRLLMSAYLLICWDEMGQYKPTVIEVMKAGLSQHVITADKKFQNTAQYPRTASFCGSTNNDAFLKDATGSRRFWPFTMLEKLDFSAYNAVNKAQLWGQIVAEYKAGADYRLTDAQASEMNDRNGTFFTADTPEDAFIAKHLVITGNDADFEFTHSISERLDEYKDYRKGQGIYLWSEVRKKLLQMPGVKPGRRRKDGSAPLNGLSGVKLVYDGR